MAGRTPTDKQRAFAVKAAGKLGVDLEREFGRLNLRRDRAGYHLMIAWLLWALERRAYLRGEAVPRVDERQRSAA